MKFLVFDSGPIINLAINNLLEVLEDLKKRYNGEFLIPRKVKEELVNRPLEGTKFKFEALRTLSFINKGIIKTIDDKEIELAALEFKQLVNQCFRKNGKNIEIIHQGEAEAIMTAKMMNAEAIVIDESTARMLIEEPEMYLHRLENKLNAKIIKDEKKLRELKEITKGLVILRSTEIITIAYKIGLLDKYLPERIPMAKRVLLESVLWALKLNGCSITNKEINRIVKKESRD